MKKYLVLLMLMAGMVLFFRVGNWGLTESSEARYATISKEMLTNNDFITPTLLGIKHLHKPPVTYYITAAGFKLFGINEFGARFFLQLALLFQLFLVYKIVQLLYKDEKLAFVASLIYFSLPITVIAARSLTTDTYLTTFILTSIVFWLQYKEKNKLHYLYLFYLFFGLIFETKGPVGLIVPTTFIVTYKIINKDKIETSIHQFLGILLFLLISFSWYLIVIYKNEGLFNYFFNHQLIERVLQNKFKREKPFWYYFLLMPLIGIPWLFFLIPYFKKKLAYIMRQKSPDYILLITFAVFFLVLSISTSKLVLYLLPLYFIIAIFSANFLKEASEKTLKIASFVMIGLTLIATLTLVVLSLMPIDFKINQIDAIIIFVVFTVLIWVTHKNVSGKDYAKPAVLGMVFIVFIIISSDVTLKDNELKVNSVKPIAEFIKSKSATNHNVLVYNYLLPSLFFYLNENIATINHGKYTTQREVQFESDDNWKNYFINYFDKKDRDRLLNIAPKNTFLIKRKNVVLPDTLTILSKQLKNKQDFGKYTVYF